MVNTYIKYNSAEEKDGNWEPLKVLNTNRVRGDNGDDDNDDGCGNDDGNFDNNDG